MAYFSNSTEGMEFDFECAECAAFKESCPIALAQWLYNYDACNNPVATKILNDLVKQEDGKYVGCQMKPILDRIKNG